MIYHYIEFPLVQLQKKFQAMKIAILEEQSKGSFH